jgi:FtsP/CotA-like multicopper oxidase with cupredoxin domain
MCLNTICNDTGLRWAPALVLATALIAPSSAAAHHHHDPRRPPTVIANDNRRPAGEWREGVWRISLYASRGRWQPEGPQGPLLDVEALGETGKPLLVPAPLLRVREGMAIAVRIENALAAPLRVHGLCTRDGSPCLPIEVPAGEAREARFIAGRAGTYHYWATSHGLPLAFRGGPDAQLSGAFVVDPADGAGAADRVLVITEWTGLSHAQLAEIAAEPDPGAAFLRLRPPVLFTVNGRAWPHTERFTYDLGAAVNWRVVNLSTQLHPMHLHGFYFDVTSQGDGLRDTTVGRDRRIRVVTHLIAPGSTMAMTWVPERAGRWLFHCHTMLHVSTSLHVDGTPKTSPGHDHNHGPGMGMTGLVIGVLVRSRDDSARPWTSAAGGVASRKVTLAMRTEPRRFGDSPALAFALAEGESRPVAGPLSVPGPVLVLERGQPVEITLVNELAEATSIHWHGMELESFYDGVHGWSGTKGRAAPMIEPGGTFKVRFTPPRAGTFIYHTHLHDNRQLTSGLYGALLVVEPGQRFDESVDHVLVIGRGGPALDAPVVINGDPSPQIVWSSGRRHRIRIINITPNDTVVAALRTVASPVPWRLLAKDGADVPSSASADTPASQTIGVGETYDFEVDVKPGRQMLWLEFKSPGGKWLAQGGIVLK